MSSGQSPLHIGFCSPALPDGSSTNGIVTYTRIMRDALKELGHRVTVVTTREIQDADGGVRPLPQPNPVAWRVRSLLEQRHKDGAHPDVRMRIMDAFAAAREAGVEIF